MVGQPIIIVSLRWFCRVDLCFFDTYCNRYETPLIRPRRIKQLHRCIETGKGWHEEVAIGFNNPYDMSRG